MRSLNDNWFKIRGDTGDDNATESHHITNSHGFPECSIYITMTNNIK